MLYLNIDDRSRPQFGTAPGFFSLEVTDNPEWATKAIALQSISTAVRRSQDAVADAGVSYAGNNTRLESLWELVTQIVYEANERVVGNRDLQLGGESAGEALSVRGSAPVTNSLSPKPLKRKA